MTLIQKLKPRPGAVALLNSPKHILGEFKPFKPVASIPAGKKEIFDFVLLFATNLEELEPAWKRINSCTQRGCGLLGRLSEKDVRHRV